MSIIEKAVAAGNTPPKRRSLQRLKKRSGIAPAQAETQKASKSFTIDFENLAAQGFYTPAHKPDRLTLELRAIKRRLMRKLDFSRHGTTRKRAGERQRNTVLLTSTRPAEGKTFTAINLALSLAIEDGINVLLIDADAPRPKVFSHLGVTAGAGLTDLITDPEQDLVSLLLKAEDFPLSLMSQGTSKESPNELFSRLEMEQFIKELSLRYPDRLIIFDAPPVLATPEAVTIAHHVDEVVFVVEANATPEPAVATALEEILDVNSHVSLLLNRCRVPERASEYGSYEEYYYKDHNKSRGHGRQPSPMGQRQEPGFEKGRGDHA